MKRYARYKSIVLIFIILLCAVLTSCTLTEVEEDFIIYLKNSTGVDIFEVFIKRHNEAAWGDNINNLYFVNGARVPITLERPSECDFRYDFRLCRGNNVYSLMDVFVINGETIVINPEDLEGYTTP